MTTNLSLSKHSSVSCERFECKRKRFGEVKDRPTLNNRDTTDLTYNADVRRGATVSGFNLPLTASLKIAGFSFSLRRACPRIDWDYAHIRTPFVRGQHLVIKAFCFSALAFLMVKSQSLGFRHGRSLEVHGVEAASGCKRSCTGVDCRNLNTLIRITSR